MEFLSERVAESLIYGFPELYLISAIFIPAKSLPILLPYRRQKKSLSRKADFKCG